MQGHEAGVKAVKKAVKACVEAGVEYISAYTFSTENWARAQEEVSFLMNLVPKVLKTYVKELNDQGVRIRLLGSRDGLSTKVLKAIEDAEQTTEHNTRGTFAICFNYGGRQELVDMVKDVVHSGKNIDSLRPDDLYDHLYCPDIPPCDLIVRTSGEHRLSGFMLARSEYAEFVFDDRYWPDVDEEAVRGYLDEYARRNRRIGA